MIFKLLTAFLFFLSLAFLSSCSVNSAKIDDSLKKHFDSAKVDGCFTLFDNVSGKVTVYNLDLDTQRFSPASTFKIVNSLIGLETGRISGKDMVIKWDGQVRPRTELNRDLSMAEAFKVSSVPYYQEVARRIGADTMKRWVDTLAYGNKNISGPIDSFWLNNTLKISPDEQLGLVKKLYFNQLPFQKYSQEIVKEVMLQEDNTAYKLSYKTGWGSDEKGGQLGWVVGWIEENNHVYFFVTLIISPDKNIDMRDVRMKVTKGILTQYGFFKGEM
ncbi:MAG: penicillin-binding transpeptidase domain-containing protein [Chitinophagaceae bacterium]